MVAISFSRSVMLMLVRLYSTTKASRPAQTMSTTTMVSIFCIMPEKLVFTSSVKLTPDTQSRSNSSALSASRACCEASAVWAATSV